MNGWRASPSLEVFTNRVHELDILAQAAGHASLPCLACAVSAKRWSARNRCATWLRRGG